MLSCIVGLVRNGSRFPRLMNETAESNRTMRDGGCWLSIYKHNRYQDKHICMHAELLQQCQGRHDEEADQHGQQHVHLEQGLVVVLGVLEVYADLLRQTDVEQ